MRPDWFRCKTCLFGEEVDADGVLLIGCYNLNKIQLKTANEFCKEWICANCWNGWDTCDYPDTKKGWIGIYHDHNTCSLVKFKGE